MRLLSFSMVAVMLVCFVSGWQNEWRPNYVNTSPPIPRRDGRGSHFKLLRVDGEDIFIGARNLLFRYTFHPNGIMYQSLKTWFPTRASATECFQLGKTDCNNYIRFMLPTEAKNVYNICGTHAYNPQCRSCNLESSSALCTWLNDSESVLGISPFNPNDNSTAIYVDGKLFTATATDADERDPVILLKYNNGSMVSTQDHDTLILNEPNFVSSYDKGDKVFFFFRETAVENINCGRVIFSRVARVCKNDRSFLNQDVFTSFFKTRLNCSIPGKYRFYFDEIQSITELGQGNYRPTSDNGSRSDMVYGVFNAPENSIRGSAVCAFKHSSIEAAFQGMFKAQATPLHNWLPVSMDATPTPHPALCPTDSRELDNTTVHFIRRHPLMNNVVPAEGGIPVLVFPSITSRFTQIAVDWQYLAADGNYYDVMFVGTDDGRVIKAINKGTENVESVVIEDIRVIPVGDPIVNLKVMRGSHSFLFVTSSSRMVTIPLHRCSYLHTCGLQSIATGTHENCSVGTNDSRDEDSVNTRDAHDKTDEQNDAHDDRRDEDSVNTVDAHDKTDEDDDERDRGLTSGSTTAKADGSAIEFVIVADIIPIISSLIVGFFIGFAFQACRCYQQRDKKYAFFQRGRIGLASGDNAYFHTDLTPKLNYLVNPDKADSMDTKPMAKPN